MKNKVLHGDCLQLLPRFEENSVRLAVADPPYYNVLLKEKWDTCWRDADEYLAWTKQWMAAVMRVLIPGGLLYCFGQTGKREHVFLHLMSQAASEYTFHDLVVWDRLVGYNVRRDSWTPAHEMVLVLAKPGGAVCFDKDAVREPYDRKTIDLYMQDKRYKDREARRAHLERGKFATNIWRVPSLKGSSKEKAGHPSQKPEALIERIVLSSSAPGEVVLDPFLGSGTSALVAARHGRDWIGIEKSAQFCELARRRIENEELRNL